MGIRKYGTSADKRVLRESSEAREIVAKIMEHGVSQKQILYIINDLALNLEKEDHMRKIVNLVRELCSDDYVDMVDKKPSLLEV